MPRVKTQYETADGIPIWQYLNNDGTEYYGTRAVDLIRFFMTDDHWGGSIDHEIQLREPQWDAAIITAIIKDNSGSEICRDQGVFFLAAGGNWSFVQAGKTIMAGRALNKLGIGIEFPPELDGEVAVGEELQHLVDKSTKMIEVMEKSPALAKKLIGEAEGSEDTKKSLQEFVDQMASRKRNSSDPVVDAAIKKANGND